MLGMQSIDASNGPQHQTPEPSSSAAILVAVRIRPFNTKEAQQLEYQPDSSSQFGPTASNFRTYEDPSKAKSNKPTIRKVVHAIDSHVLVFDPPDENDTSGRSAPVAASNKRHKDIRFAFDRVYSEECSQQDVYEGTTRGLLDAVMNGYNATVFAYGATGCGKTYTITGTPSDPGVVVLTMQELFERVHAVDEGEGEGKSISVTLSYLEVYNETIRDLLDPSNKSLALRDDAQQSVTVAGLSIHSPKTVSDVMTLMQLGNTNRTMSATEANAVSSRSHAVLQVHVRQTSAATRGLSTDVTTATLSIIDLAGSERATVTNNQGARMREGANINRSLLALANCINALCDHKRKRHVPYRDSKLTRLLKFSLGGNCRTVMITCVSPASTYYEETHNTLKYANRAKNIRTSVARNTTSAAVHLAQYRSRIRAQSAEIARLQRELAAALKRNTAGGSVAAGGRTNVQAMAELRRQTQAVQVVQDLRNRMAAAYAPVREARWEYASAAPVAQWYDYYAESLHAWRDQFVIQQQEVSRNALAGNQQQQQALAFCQQVNELEQDLERERTVIGRRADHAAKQIEQNSAVAHNALQAPVRLTREQQYQIDQEQRVFELLAERNALRRHAEIGERMAEDLAKQNAEAMRVVAACLCSLKQAMGYVQTMDQEQSGAEDSARRDMVVGQLDAIYSQAITAFTAATGAVRRGVGEVRAAGGPSMLVFSGSSLVPPSPFVPRKSPATSRISQTDHTLPPPPPLSFTLSQPQQQQNVRARRRETIGEAVSVGRRLRASPAKRSQAILGRKSASARARGSPVPRRVRAPVTGTGGSNDVFARLTASNNDRRLSRRTTKQQSERSSGEESDNNTVSVGGRSTFTVGISSPRPQKMGRKNPPPPSSLPSSSKALPVDSPDSITDKSFDNSLVMEDSSFASNGTDNPGHEPLPPAARPAKGILKNTDKGKAPASTTGPVRFGSAKRKERVLRAQRNPMGRGNGTPIKATPPKSTPTKPTTTVRELSFRSLGGVRKPAFK